MRLLSIMGRNTLLNFKPQKKIAQMAKIDSFTKINIQGLLKSVSPLVSSSPLEQYESNEQMEKTIGDRVELTFVPMRNPLFLTIAANHALSKNCRYIWTGVCADDNANYPDCTPTFISAMQEMVNSALGIDGLTIVAPLLKTPKHEAIASALKIQGCYVALAYSHTSYAGDYPPYNRNHATILREESFRLAGIPDPLILRAHLEGRMVLPDEDHYNLPQYLLLQTETGIDGCLIGVANFLRSRKWK